jgi:hypothetical protein
MASSPPVALDTSRLVSRYGVRPSRGTGAPHMHAGIDIGSSRRSREDEPVFAVKGGTVVLVSTNTPGGSMSGYGNAVVIRHDGGRYALYAHLKDGSITVTPGQTVAGGQRIGLMGNTTNGNFSPLPTETTEVWERRARARGYRSGPMVRHLHFELRVPRPDGTSPFPGPYPQSPEEAQFNVDPQPWFNEMGLFFSSRGAARVDAGTPMDRSRALWSAAMAGTLSVMGLSGSEIDALGPLGQARAGGTYEPPEPERDAKWGITKTEWGMLAAGGIVLTAGVAALIIRSRMSPNRRRSGPRKNRLRAWGSK